MLDLQQISADIKEDIDAAILANAESSPRKHLGASIIGHECKAYLWFTFRWAVLGQGFGARMLRLFERGHLEEQRFVRWLRDAGWTVEELDPATGKQWRMSAVLGHYGGSCDGIGWHPKYPDLGKVILEFKTKGTGRGFSSLADKGIALEAPQHFSQMSQYGKAFGLEYGLYQVINKNDDDLIVEAVKLDGNRANADLQKAEDIITSQFRPERVSATETYFKCKSCQFINVCHRGATMDVSCRSCTNAKPVDGGNWYCGLYQNNIPEDFIPQACPQWSELEH